MGRLRSLAGILTGLAVTTGAFGAAATMSAATAHADDFTDVIASVQGDYTAGASALSSAYADLASANDFLSGLALLFAGVDDDSVSPAENFLVGSVDVLTGHGVVDPLTWGFEVPGSFSEGVTAAESLFATGENYFTQAAADLAGGDYADASYLDALGFEYTTVGPLQELLLGAAAALDPGAIVY